MNLTEFKMTEINELIKECVNEKFSDLAAE